MKQKIMIGILALIIIFASTASIDAVSTKKNKFADENSPYFITVSGGATLTLSGLKADTITLPGGEFVDTDGTLKEYIGVRYYRSYVEIPEVIRTDKINILYEKDPLDPDNNNVLQKDAIRADALSRFGWILPLQDITYMKKTAGNQ